MRSKTMDNENGPFIAHRSRACDNLPPGTYKYPFKNPTAGKPFLLWNGSKQVWDSDINKHGVHLCAGEVWRYAPTTPPPADLMVAMGLAYSALPDSGNGS